jgi:hypothetical protein
VPIQVTPWPTPTCQAPRIVDLLPSSGALDTMTPITITCTLDSPVHEGLTFAWSASNGDILGTHDTVTYQSDVVGTHTITVSVRGDRCGEDERTLQVRVDPASCPDWSPELPPESTWGRIWHGDPRVRRGLGCPIGSEQLTRGAQQEFERGKMFWIDHVDVEGEPIYALFEDGTWQLYQGTWREGMPEYSCPEVAPSDPNRTPRRGFGDIWCNQMNGPNSALGWAEAPEKGYYPRWIRFERGLMLLGTDGQLYILYRGGTWESPGMGSVSVQVLDDFEQYTSTVDLNAAYGITAHGSNAGSLHLIGAPIASGSRGAAFTYQIAGQQADYCGFDRTFDPPQDWRAFDRLRVWVQNEGGGSELVVQFREAGGETWKRRFDLGSLGAQYLDIVLELAALELEGEAAPGTRLDLGRIDQIGFHVNGRDGVGGTLYVDSIRLIRQGT